MTRPADHKGPAAGLDDPPDQPAHTNRLVDESSPYLLQHAHNPVDWWPWSEEAIQRARDEDRLIFLSVGYSTCYWCHVMERESFEDEATAALMNRHFINIKVDREERPDVDDIYMMAVQAMTGRGGWPMSVWIDPDTLRPVYTGTYFPKDARHGLPSFAQIINAIADAWENNRAALLGNGERLAAALHEELAGPRPVVTLSPDLAAHSIQQLLGIYDPKHGGFGRAPKFPQPVYLDLLLTMRGWVDESTRDRIDGALSTTLDAMALGGIFDQVGGGFHRYSTDEKWLVPHFEKMLYDNGQLASIYARAAEIHDDEFHRAIVRQTLDYVLREMRDGERGGFFSAQDAEVDAREGLNYLWTKDEIADELRKAGRDDLVDFAVRVFGVDQGPNFRDPHHSDEPPRNVLYLIARPEEAAQRAGMSREDFDTALSDVRRILLAARDRRKQPGLDDKVITAWNGLMIAGFADGGRVLGEERYLDAAAGAAEFILQEMRTGDGGLYRTWREGSARVDAFLDDYAALALGLIALYQATDDPRWWDAAIEIVDAAHERFHDDINGAYFDTLADRPDLLLRVKSSYDGAVPSGNGMLLRAFVDLHEITGDERYLDLAADSLRGLSGMIARAPATATLSTIAMMEVALLDAERLPRAIDGPRAEVELEGLDELRLDRDAITITDEGSDIITISMRIGDDFHIIAHEPGDPSLIGLLVRIVGAEGIAVEAAYPPAETYEMPGFEGAINIHRGEISIPVRLAVIGEVKGTPRLAVRWQACTDRECLAPQEHVFDLDVTIE